MSVDQENEIQNKEPECLSPAGVGTRLFYLLVGGGIGAAIALLFAPKAGREMRRDIEDAAGKGLDETIEAANRVKRQTIEYYDAAKEKGGEVLDVVADGLTAVKKEISDDAARIGQIVEAAASKRSADSSKTIH